jgi:hypothetical protein
MNHVSFWVFKFLTRFYQVRKSRVLSVLLCLNSVCVLGRGGGVFSTGVYDMQLSSEMFALLLDVWVSVMLHLYCTVQW